MLQEQQEETDEEIASQADSASSAIGEAVYNHNYGLQCLAVYGRPDPVECGEAIVDWNQLPPNPGQYTQRFHFISSDTRQIDHSQADAFDLNTPRTFQSGDCFVTIFPPGPPSYYLTVSRSEVEATMEDIVEDCVIETGFGGSAHRWLPRDRVVETRFVMDDSTYGELTSVIHVLTLMILTLP